MKAFTPITQNITMQDIANEAGVSIATVSRVFNGSNKVTPSTKNKIFEIAQKYNFQPNATARTLAAKKSNLIAVVLPDVSNPYFTELLKNIEEICTSNGYTIIFYNSDGEIDKERRIVQQMISRQIDGMFISLTVLKSETLSLLKKAPFPIVLMSRTEHGIDSVGIRHTDGGILAAQYMISKGVKDFYYFGTDSDEKYLGFYEELIENNISAEKIKVIGEQDWYFKTAERGGMILENFIRNNLGNEKSGLFCINDIYAAHALIAAKESGIKVPEQLSIVGFDDTMLCNIVRPALTSVHQPLEEIAKFSFEILSHRISEFNLKTEKTVENIILKPSLIVRET